MVKCWGMGYRKEKERKGFEENFYTKHHEGWTAQANSTVSYRIISYR
jgi:hypothetical protein